MFFWKGKIDLVSQSARTFHGGAFWSERGVVIQVVEKAWDIKASFLLIRIGAKNQLHKRKKKEKPIVQWPK